MLPVFKHNKRQVHTSRPGLLGGRIQTVELNGRMFEVKKHKMHGLHIQPAHYATGVDVGTTCASGIAPSVSSVQPHQNASISPFHASKASTKKKLSSILRGGALAPL